MIEYRISKYNPLFRVNGKYTLEDWTGTGDVGRVFNGCELTQAEYMATIYRYIDCVMEIVAAAQVSEFIASDIEIYSADVRWRNGEVLMQQKLRDILADCLQENIWCRLSGRESFIHFGYDLYVYVGCELDYSSMERICSRYGLFVEECISPYKDA